MSMKKVESYLFHSSVVCLCVPREVLVGNVGIIMKGIPNVIWLMGRS
jgi:hypothetical protein